MPSPPQQAVYYIVQAPPPKQIYRTDSAESAAPTYSAQPSSTGDVAIPAPPPSAMQFPGPTYFIASPYPFPSNGGVFQGSPYPFAAGSQFLQGPTLVAPPYEKKQKKTKVTSNRIA
uniref:DAZ-associated protein 2 n=1 Tax=Panagrolaimus sp. PS1159 TaxID=55785 RepID=A0AC35G7J1_9BILA